MQETNKTTPKAPGKIPVLSMLQPWASLLVKGLKGFETRSWNTKHRGPLLIHASAAMKPEHRGLFRDYIPENERPLGAIIGAVYVHTTQRTEEAERKLADFGNYREISFGDYGENRFAWEVLFPLQFEKPVPYKGGLSIWDASKKGDRLALLDIETQLRQACEKNHAIAWDLLLKYGGLIKDLRAPQSEYALLFHDLSTINSPTHTKTR